MIDPNNDISGPGPEPSILLFGSLALSFDSTSLEQLRKTIIESDENVWLADIIRHLSDDCETVLLGLPALHATGAIARRQLTDLNEAFTTGRNLDAAFPLPNTVLIPLVIINQLAQYAAFVKQSNDEKNSENDIWAEAKGNRETLGLCTGLLSAFAASSAHSIEEFRRYGAAAVRLGMLVGLVVDNQDAVSGRGRSKSLTAAWSSAGGAEEITGILEGFNEVGTILLDYETI